MLKRVLIIGGYGNFGGFITRRLAMDPMLQIIIAGRSLNKGQRFAKAIQAANAIEVAALDITVNLAASLSSLSPDIVVHTSGPFQKQGYEVAEACIVQGCHYIDLADGRDFVAGINVLNQAAQARNVRVVSGASSVPCLTSAIIDHYISEFSALEHLDYGISTAQRTNRGLATTAAILGYTGKPFETLIDGRKEIIYGWQNLHVRKYHGLGWRLLGNCDVPDLTLFPKRYPQLKTVRFYAGLEIAFIHVVLWMLSWLVRLRIMRRLERAAPLLLKLARLFDWAGSANSGFYMNLSGQGRDGRAKSVTFDLVARSGDGPYIPCIPAILMVKKLTSETVPGGGAGACVGFITLDEYLGAFAGLDIEWVARNN